jgi:hypothetical protein
MKLTYILLFYEYIFQYCFKRILDVLEYKHKVVQKIFLLLIMNCLFAEASEKQIFDFRARAGLPNICEKINQKDTVRVAYLGGSITAQAGWRVQSFTYLKEQFPNTPFVEINATMGGTGSLLGVLRMDKDVLRYNPDLVFVEFAVNDSETASQVVLRSMEGIVRKLWKQNPFCDICFVYTVTESILEKTGLEQVHHTVIEMERIADYYGIPSVYLPRRVIDLLQNGQLIMRPPLGQMLKVSGDELNENSIPRKEDDGKIYFSPDGVHPFLNTGHVLYMQMLRTALDTMLCKEGTAFTHLMRSPLSVGNYEGTKSISVGSMQPKGPWLNVPKDSSLYKNYQYRFDELWIGEVGATLEFTFKGSGLVSYDIISPEGCRLEITVDGKKSYVDRFDGYCTYPRFHYAELISNLDRSKSHKVLIRIVDTGLDKYNILFEQNRKDLQSNPDKYEPIRWYLNSLFIIP